MKDEMVNKDTVTKQQEQMKNLSAEIKNTEQLLNLQLSNEHNTVMTDLSHILNKRNSLLLECEGLKNTVAILYEQLAQAHHHVEEQQQESQGIAEQLQEVERMLSTWQSAKEQLEREMRECGSGVGE